MRTLTLRTLARTRLVRTLALRTLAGIAFMRALTPRLTRSRFAAALAVMAVILMRVMRVLARAIAVAAARRTLTFGVTATRAAMLAALSAAFRRPAGNAIAIGIPRAAATATSATTTAPTAAFAIALARHRSRFV